jgi:signal transduction histidine kinase
MRERVQALDGRFELRQCQPSGIEIRVHLPFTQAQRHE